MNREVVELIIRKHEGSEGGLISILQDIQARFNYLPEEALRMVAAETGKPLTEIYGMATFYKSFSLKPRGKNLLSVCLGTACHVRGGQRIAAEFRRHFGIEPGHTTPDKEFSFETVNCLGACALGPVVVVNGHYFSKVNPQNVTEILEKTRRGLDRVDIKMDKGIFQLQVNCSHCNHSLMDEKLLLDGHPSIRVTISFGEKHGPLNLSSLYGSYSIQSEHEIPADEVVNFFCPHCHAEMRSITNCLDCGAPMVPMIVKKGGMVQICSRRGCKRHILDLEGVNL